MDSINMGNFLSDPALFHIFFGRLLCSWYWASLSQANVHHQSKHTTKYIYAKPGPKKFTKSLDRSHCLCFCQATIVRLCSWFLLSVFLFDTLFILGGVAFWMVKWSLFWTHFIHQDVFLDTPLKLVFCLNSEASLYFDLLVQWTPLH